MNIQIPNSGSATDMAMAMVMAAADPKATQERLAALEEARLQYEEMYKQANAAIAAQAAKDKELAALAKKLDVATKALDKEKETYRQEVAQYKAAMAAAQAEQEKKAGLLYALSEQVKLDQAAIAIAAQKAQDAMNGAISLQHEAEAREKEARELIAKIKGVIG